MLLYWRQENAIFFPVHNDPVLRQQFQNSRVEIASGEATLEGWWIDNPRPASPAVILYFGGNAEDLLYTARQAVNLDARRLLLVNYRGYGRSTGEPGQQALYDDALAIYDFVISSGVHPGNVVVMGRSLGSGVAAMLAGHRPVGGAILVTPFDSLASVASDHYPFVPVRMLLRHPFPSGDWARNAKSPALLLAAEHDNIVAPVHAQKLHEAWAGPKQLHVLAGVGHNDIERNSTYYTLINEFLTAISTPATSPPAAIHP